MTILSNSKKKSGPLLASQPPPSTQQGSSSQQQGASSQAVVATSNVDTTVPVVVVATTPTTLSLCTQSSSSISSTSTTSNSINTTTANNDTTNLILPKSPTISTSSGATTNVTSGDNSDITTSTSSNNKDLIDLVPPTRLINSTDPAPIKLVISKSKPSRKLRSKQQRKAKLVSSASSNLYSFPPTCSFYSSSAVTTAPSHPSYMNFKDAGVGVSDEEPPSDDNDSDDSDIGINKNLNSSLYETGGLILPGGSDKKKMPLGVIYHHQNKKKHNSSCSSSKKMLMNISGGGSGKKLDHHHKTSPRYDHGCNSEDEYENSSVNCSRAIDQENIQKMEDDFRRVLKEKKGFIIKKVKEDGACLFRSVADQIYGDEDMHSTIRSHCMDYIAKNADYFKQYITEDFDRYLERKRQDWCFGNHIEIIAIAEIYNRPIEVYEYSAEPRNTFQSAFKTDNEPIRLSYHDRNHYNSVINPYKATIGVGLGLPELVPGLAERNLMSDALKKSEEFHIEQAMLDDKLKATDWEATNEEIMELAARESYFQWLADNEKRSKKKNNMSSFPLQTTSSNTLNTTNGGGGYDMNDARCSKWDQHTQNLLFPDNLLPTGSNNSSSSKSRQSSPVKEQTKIMSTPPPPFSGVGHHHDDEVDDDWNMMLQMEAAAVASTERADDSDILAQVLALSQQEYLDGLKAKHHQQHHNFN